jgi:uncharacterized protein DUF4333
MLSTLRARRSSRRFFVGAVVALAAAACGATGPDLFDVAGARRGILSELQRTYPAGTVTTVKCPKRVVLKVGRIFKCRATIGTAFLPVKVQIGTRSRYTVEPLGIVVTKQVAEQAVAARATLPATSVDCGVDPVHVVDVGGTIACSATLADGSKVNAIVRVADAAGHLNLEVPA